MSCGIETALAELGRGHVTWEQLHPRGRSELERAGNDASGPWGTEPSEDRRILQLGERYRSGVMAGAMRRRAQKGIDKRQ